MQRMIPHPQPLPRCADGHPARHMHDQRGRHCGGGHFIECACRHSQRFDSFDQALGNWRQVNGSVATPVRSRVLPLRAPGRAGGSQP
jgi:hypothetical protein